MTDVREKLIDINRRMLHTLVAEAWVQICQINIWASVSERVVAAHRGTPAAHRAQKVITPLDLRNLAESSDHGSKLVDLLYKCSESCRILSGADIDSLAIINQALTHADSHCRHTPPGGTMAGE